VGAVTVATGILELWYDTDGMGAVLFEGADLRMSLCGLFDDAVAGMVSSNVFFSAGEGARTDDCIIDWANAVE